MKSVRRAIVLVFFAAPLFAQNPLPSGNIYGSIHDEQGGVLRSVTVTLSGPGAPQFMESDARGEFHFLYLDPGRYSLVLDLAQFVELRRDDIQVSLGRDINFAFTMRIAGAKEAVTQSSGMPLVDTRRTHAGSTFEQKELESIPTSRDIWAIAQQVPGVLIDDVNVGGNKSTQEPAFIGKGSGPHQNSYNLDGVDVTAPGGGTGAFFDFDAIHEIRITSGGSDPETSAPGVTINVVTKRGTNALRGSARLLYTPGSWQSSNTPEEDRRAATDGTLYLRDYGAEMGGPLVDDRIWLWGAGSRVDSNISKTAQILPNGTIPTEHTTLESWTGKVDVQPSVSNTLTLLGTHFDTTLNGEFLDPTHPPDTTENKSNPLQTWKVEDSHEFSSSLVASAYYSEFKGRIGFSPVGGPNTDVYIDPDGIQHGSNFIVNFRGRTRQVGTTASSFFDTGAVSHELKFGFGYNHGISSSTSAWPGNGVIADEADGLALITRQARNSIDLDYLDAYLSDVLTAGNFTLSAGARFDYQRGKNLPSSVAANPEFPDLLPAVNYAGDSGYPITWRNLLPRISATYALDRERKTLLRASYAQFADRLRDDEILSLNAFPAVSYLYYSWADTNGNHKVDRGELGALYSWSNVDPNNPASTASPNKVASGLRAPTTDELIFGIDRQLPKEIALSLSYTYRVHRNTIGQPARGVTASDYMFGGYAVGTAVATDGFTLPIDEPYYFLKGGPPVGEEIVNRPGYYETYRGLELQVVKPMSHGWMARGSFAYNDSRQHVPRSSIIDPNNIPGASTENGGVVAVQSGRPGRSGIYIGSKWQFNISGLATLPAGIQGSINFFGRQGYVAPYSVGVVGAALLQIGATDSHRFDNVYELDAGLSKPFQVGPATITASLDCFNVLNRNTVLQRDLLAGRYHPDGSEFDQNTDFNHILEVQSPRIFGVGVRVGF